MRFWSPRLAWLLLARRKAGLSLAVIAIALGVAAVCAIDVVNRAVLRGFTGALERLAGRAALQVTAADGNLFPETVAVTLGGIAGVERVVPVMSATTFVAGESGEPLLVHGIELARDEVVRIYEPDGLAGSVDRALLVREPGAVLVTNAFAAPRGIALGARVALDTPTGRRSVPVAGVIEPEGLGRIFGGNVTAMDLAAAEAIFGRPGYINRIDLVVADGVLVEDIERAVRERLPAGLRIATPMYRRLDLTRVTASFRIMLWGIAVIGVVLSFLVAFSRLTTHFESRMWEVAMLRAIGLRRRLVWRELMKEAALLAAAGAGLGIPLGIALGRLALPLVARTAAMNYKLDPTTPELVVRTPSIALGVAVGFAAALLAAAWPSWRAARVAVAETLWRRGTVQPAVPGARGTIVGGALFAVTAAVIALQYIRVSPTWGIAATGLVVVTAALGTHVLLVAVRAPLLKCLHPLAGPAAPFACAAIFHDLRRTSLAAATIGVGVGCVLWVLTLAGSFERTLARVLGATLRAELVVASPHLVAGWVPAPVSDGVVDDIRTVPGVAAAAGNRILEQPFRGETIAINAFDAAYLMQPEFGRSLLRGPAAAGAWDAVARGEAVIVSTNFALNFGVRVGETITLETRTGPLSLPVVATSVAFMSPRGTVEISRELVRARWDDPQVNRIWVRTAPGADVAAVRHALAARTGATYGLRVLSAGEMIDHLLRQVRRAFAPVHLAHGVVLLVVLLGMADALAAGILLRTRELGSARAIGVRRRALERMVVVEALVLGLVGVIVAMAIGLVLSVLWVDRTFPYLLGWVLEWHLPWIDAGRVILLTLAVCLAAAVLPARHAARVEPAVALRYE